MKILTISDSFKGTISSSEVGKIISKYYQDLGHDATYIPVSDGGEGFLDVISYITSLPKSNLVTKDANFNDTYASYIIDKEKDCAYLELAEASGIAKIDKDNLNALGASTFGFGILMKEVILKYHPKRIVVGIGGSATTDLGAGMLEAMGVEFLDKDGFLIREIGNTKLMHVKKINTKKFEKLIKGIEFITLSDVTNPLFGEKGSVKVFASQKGATEKELLVMEKHLVHLHKVLIHTYKKNFEDFPGAGAAGGVGYTMKYLFNSKIVSGIDEILKLVSFDKLVKEYDVIITGEGCFDNQSLDGKVISGIKKYQPTRLIIVCGKIKFSEEIENVYSIVPMVATEEESLSFPKDSLLKLLPTIKL